MANVNILFNRFTGGECSPLLAGRMDYFKYQSGLSRLENFIPLIQGPLRKRGGTRFVSETKYPHLKSWLLKFEFSENVAYVIEVGHKYFRFYTGRGVLLADDGQTPYEIATPYTVEELARPNGILALKYVQTGDVVYMVHPNHKPKKLSRHSPTDWRLEDMPGWPGVKADDEPLTRANPEVVAFFRERLCLAAKQTLWFSASGAFEDFNLPGDDPAADDPIEISIYSEETNNIEWMCPASGLLVGTSGGEFLVGEVTMADPLGPGNVKITPHTSYGSLGLKPARIGGSILFVQKAGRKVRELRYDYASDNYAADNLTSVAEHITKSGLIDLAWQQEPDHVLWMARADGVLVGLTYSREQEMVAWHRHLLGGCGRVESLAAIASPQADIDDLWLIVKRTVGGREVRWVEFMTPGYRDSDEDYANIPFVDASLSYEGAPAQKFSGLDHLEGLEISILADGAVHPSLVVKDGSFTLHNKAGNVQAGIAYSSVAETMNPDWPLSSGTLQGRTKRLVGVILRLWCSLGGAVGPHEHCLEYLMWRKGSDPMDKPHKIFTGDTGLIHWPGGYDQEGRIMIYHAEPLPFTLVAIMPKMSVEGGA